MALLPVDIRDTIDIFRQKVNAIVNQVNNLPSVTPLINLINPVNSGDTLFFNTTNQKFENSSFEGKVQDYLDAQNIRPVSEIEQLFLSTMGGNY